MSMTVTKKARYADDDEIENVTIGIVTCRNKNRRKHRDNGESAAHQPSEKIGSVRELGCC
ncbi:MAG: hypothetical protein GY801_01045 [bacterium]|nr:hypothetical protein [bacterium]